MDLHEISPELVLVDPELAALARLQLPEPGSFWASNVPPPATAHSSAEAARPVEETMSAIRKRRARRPLLLLAAASLTLNALFIAHAQRSVPRPSFVADASGAGATAGDLLVGPVDPATAAMISAPLGTASPSRQSRPAAKTTQRRQATGALGAAVDSTPRRRIPHGVLSRHAAEQPATPRRTGEHVTVHTVAWDPVPDATYYNLVLWRDGKRVLDLWPTSSHAVVPNNWSRDGVEGRLLPGRYLWFVYPGLGAKASQQYGKLAGNGSFVVAATKGG